MEIDKLKKGYKELQKKFSLPEFDDLDREFEIRDITNENIILREIRDRILEKFEHYNKVIEGVVQPENNLAQIFESKVFDENEKQEIFRIFKRLMYLDRFSIQTEIEDGDEKNAEFIQKAFDEWKDLKPEILNIIKKLKESWTKDEQSAGSVEYLG